MQVFLAKHAGFCEGVKNALNLTLREVAKGKEVTTLGPLVHNEKVVQFLKDKKVKVAEYPEEIEKGAVIIRAHGVAPNILEYLQNRPELEVVDATCKFVKRVQKIAYDHSNEEFQVLIFGDKRHPEVQALLGWGGRKAVVIEPGRVDSWPDFDFSSGVVLISQTTQREKDFLAAAASLKKICPHLVVYNTICRATMLRQNAAADLASTVELMLVVGDPKSSNTNKLTQVCREITKTHQVTGAQDICAEWLVGIHKVGVTAGASTPDWMIKEVMVRMENGNVEARTEVFSEEQEAVKDYRPGDVVTGKVVLVEDSQLLVDIGYKSEAILPKTEVLLKGDANLGEVFSQGDSIDLLILKINEQEDRIIVSKKRLERERRWKELEDALDSGTNMTGVVKEVVQAGIIVDLGSGLEGFMPGSLVDVRYIPDFQQFMGQEVYFKIIELNRERDKVILSRKQALEEESEKERYETLNNLKEGEVISGVVKRLTDFGAFVDVGGIDGLVHISEISWQRVGHPQDVLGVGEEINVKVLEVIPKKERISLSIRQALPDPWSRVNDEFKAEDIIKGHVTRIVNFGAFVELIPGVEGLVHISQMADFHVKHPSEILQEGEEVQVKILDINIEGKRISLSIKDARPAPRDFSMNSQKEQESQNVTLGDVFGDLFNNTNDSE